MLQGYASEVESRDGKHSRDTPSSFSGHMGAGLGPRHYTVHLRAVLLLQFMEHLDKLMYNAYEGSCVTLPPVPKVGETSGPPQGLCTVIGNLAIQLRHSD